MPSIKQLTKYLAVVVLLATVFGPFDTALADNPGQGAYDAPSILPTDQAYYGTSFSTADGTGETAYKNTGTAVNSTTGKPNSQAPTNNTECSGITGCLAAMVYYIGPGFASWVASWSAYFFDFIVRISLDSGVYALGFLTQSWGIVLSLANMFFIFILIYAAFSIMLRAETARTMQTLAWVIAIALVVNFSFFFTRVIIDAGNILGVQFYNAVAFAPDIPSISSGGTAIPDITKPIMKAIAVDQLLGGQSFNIVSQGLGGGTAASWSTLLVFTVVFLFAAVIFWVLAVALLMVGLKFFLRVVGLWLVLVASPLAFVAQTVSGTRKFFQQWLRSLLGLSMYPAVFLFMFWVLNQFAAQLGGGLGLLGINNSTSTVSASAVQADPMLLITLIANVSIRMMFIITMLYVMLRVSDWVIEQAGGMAVTLVSRGAAVIAGGGFRTAASFGAFAGRNTVGRAAYAAAQSGTFKDMAANSRFGIGSSLWRGASALSRGSFDIRNAPAAGQAGRTVGTLSRTRDVNTGKASSSTFTQSVNNRAKAVEQEGAALGTASVKEARALGEDAAKAAARARMSDYGEGKGTRNISNLGLPSWGSLKGAAALRKALDGERAKVATSARATSAAASSTAPARPIPAVRAQPTSPSPAIPAAAAPLPAAVIPNTAAGRPSSTGISTAAEQHKTTEEGVSNTVRAGVVAAALGGEPDMTRSTRTVEQPPTELSAPAPQPTPAVAAPVAQAVAAVQGYGTMPQHIEVNLDGLKEEMHGLRKYITKLDHKDKERLATMAEEIQGHITKAAAETNRRLERDLERKLGSRTEEITHISDASPLSSKPDDTGPRGPTGGVGAMPIPKMEPPNEDDIPPHYRIAAE